MQQRVVVMCFNCLEKKISVYKSATAKDKDVNELDLDVSHESGVLDPEWCEVENVEWDDRELSWMALLWTLNVKGSNKELEDLKGDCDHDAV